MGEYSIFALQIVYMEDLLELNYGYLFEEELIKEIKTLGAVKHVQAGERLIDFGDHIKFMPLLLKGAIKISRQDDNGDELLLYFIEKGDTCAMTMTCCLGQKKSEIRATAETEVELIMIPVEKMNEWVVTYKSWRNFVFESYNSRLTEMLEAIDSLAFLNMPERVEKYLRDKVMINKDTELNVTHQEIAYDLNSSRVVISRILKKLEKEGKIELLRNKIKVLEF